MKFSSVTTSLKKITSQSLKKGLVLFPYSRVCCQLELLSLIHGPNNMKHHRIKIADEPRKANTLLIMGLIEKTQLDTLKQIYNQLLPPKHVVAAGVCACSGGLFHDQENIVNDLDAHIPVNAYIPGCPARPEQIIGTFVRLKT